MLAPFLFPEAARFVPVPPELAHLVAPAQLGLFEWTDYHFAWPRADKLRADGALVQKLAPGIWRVRWENRVGNARLIPLDETDKPVEAPLEVEVLSPKFPTFEAHIHFFAALWRELASRFPPLLWNAAAQGTRRGASVERGTPSSAETLDWLELWGEPLEALGRAIERRPSLHQSRDEWEAPLSQVRRIEGGQLGALMNANWTRSGARPLPHNIPQSRWNETPSPLRVRFGSFVARVLATLKDETGDAARAWKRRLGVWSHPAPTPPLVARDPLALQLLEIEAAFGVAGTPLWGTIEHAARLRDIAVLWEWWVLLALVRELEAATGERALWSDAFDDMLGLRTPALVYFGARSLLYNGATPSYSTPLRPDFVWRDASGKPLAALDAKFRMNVERGSVVGDDLHKMHAYRDALGVGVALALHPGERSVFYDRERGPLQTWNIRAALGGALSGVGAWGLRP